MVHAAADLLLGQLSKEQDNPSKPRQPLRRAATGGQSLKFTSLFAR